MSAREAADAFVAGWREDAPRFGIINFANPDMVGHTGSIPAAIKACETVDACLGDVVRGGARRAAASASSPPTTATPTRCSRTTARPTPRTRSTRSRSSSPSHDVALDGEGILADVAPTVLALLGIEQPAAMTGRSLLA